MRSTALSRAEQEVSVVINSLRQAYPSAYRSGQEYKGDLYIHIQIFKHYESSYLIA